MDDRWIFESPDGGKTITKRKAQDDDKWIFIGERPTDEWQPFSHITELARREIIEMELREKHPPLQEAWEHYQLLLSLYQGENTEDK